MIAMFALGLVLKIPPVWLVEVEIGLKLMHSRQCLAVFTTGCHNFVAPCKATRPQSPGYQTNAIT